MNENWIWWAVQLYLNALDFVILYFIAHALMKKYMIVKLQHIVFIIVYTMITAFASYYLDSFSTRVISHFTLMVMIKFMIKRSDVSDLLMIYMLSFIILGIIQTPIVAIIWGLNQFFELGNSIILLVAQALTVATTIPVCKKFKWHQLFYAIHANVVLKMVLFIFALFISIVMFILNFEFQVSHLIIFTSGIFLVGVALLPIILRLYKNTLDIMSVHDLKNELLSMAFAIKDMDDLDAVKNLYSEFASEFGVNVSKLNVSNAKDKRAYMDEMEENIKSFIQMKLENRNIKLKVTSNIRYYEPHEVVDYKTTLKWLGTLLDNAIDASDQNPIYISLFSMDDDFKLKVANEYVGDGGKDIKLIFEKGYTTKEEGQGIGLHNLYTKVTELGGAVEVDEYYTEAHNCHYLQIDIKFEK